MSGIKALAHFDSNISALINWGITPRIGEDGKLAFDGVERWDDENKDGLRRWLTHKSGDGEIRTAQIRRALMTGMPVVRVSTDF